MVCRGLERVERCCSSRASGGRGWLERSCDKRLRTSRLRSASRNLSSLRAVLLSVAQFPPLPRLASRSEERESRSQPDPRKYRPSLVGCRNAAVPQTSCHIDALPGWWRAEVGQLYQPGWELGENAPSLIRGPVFRKTQLTFLEPTIPYTSEASKKENVNKNLWKARLQVGQFSPFNWLS
jgi:hypothetical protein